MSNVIPITDFHADPALFAEGVEGSISGSTEGEEDRPLEIYVARFFGSDHFHDGTVHIGIHDNSTKEQVSCSIILTANQAHRLALSLLKPVKAA